MLNFFRDLFSTSSFMPHGHCYLWQPEILWLHVISDAIIGLAYFTIPFVLIRLVRKRRDLAFNWVFVMFGFFIFACGTTHLISIWTVWEPVYRLDGLVKGITAVASIATAIAVWPLLPHVLALPSSAQLSAANEELRREIAERKKAEEALAERNRALIEAEKLKSAFVANISHELRTPLTLILAPTESLLAPQLELPLPVQQTIGTIHNNALRMLQLVNGLLDFAKLEAQQVTITRESLDIRRVSQGLFADFAGLMQSKNLRGFCDIADELMVREMDRFLFERIVFNLLSNAVKFTPAGGQIRLQIESVDAHRIKVSVADTGVGIAESDLPHLFQTFRQLEDSSTRRFEGTGLGLSLVKQFSELLGGAVSVVSRVGEGSTFTVELEAPLGQGLGRGDREQRARWVPEKISLVRPVTQSQALPLVLIAEDNDELATYIQSLLIERCRTAVVSDGEAALAFVDKQAPDLILSDVMMPKRDGISLCRAIKDDPKTSQIPIVMLTALTHREALLRGWEAGADEYLFKPFHPTELLTRVTSILRRVESSQRALAEERLRLREQVQREQAEGEVERLAKIETELRRMHRVKDEFLATVSHELRTPMVAILGWTELLYAKEVEPDEYEAIFETLYRNAKNQSQLIESLLDISRMISGKIAIETVPLALDQLIVESLASVQLSAEAKNLSFDLNLDPNMGPIAGDPLRVKQVVWNLLTNAIKFSHAGSQVEITLKSNADGPVPLAELSIRDDGEGIDPLFLPHLFERFLQENQSSTRRHGGLGLGLSIVKHIVELHGGRLEAFSEWKGKGALFKVFLPLAQGESSLPALRGSARA